MSPQVFWGDNFMIFTYMLSGIFFTIFLNQLSRLTCCIVCQIIVWRDIWKKNSERTICKNMVWSDKLCTFQLSQFDFAAPLAVQGAATLEVRGAAPLEVPGGQTLRPRFSSTGDFEAPPNKNELYHIPLLFKI